VYPACTDHGDHALLVIIMDMIGYLLGLSIYRMMFLYDRIMVSFLSFLLAPIMRRDFKSLRSNLTMR
jgi:hypothetical protein